MLSASIRKKHGIWSGDAARAVGGLAGIEVGPVVVVVHPVLVVVRVRLLLAKELIICLIWSGQVPIKQIETFQSSMLFRFLKFWKMPYSGELTRDKQEVEVEVAEEERVRGRGWDQHDQRGRGQDRHGQAGQGSRREGEGEAEMRVDMVCSTVCSWFYDIVLLQWLFIENVILVSSGDLSVLAIIAT